MKALASSLFDGQGYTAYDCKTLGRSTFCSCKKSSKLCNAKCHRYCTENEFFHYGFLHKTWPKPHFSAELATFTEEVLNGKLHFLTQKWMSCWHIHNYVWYFFHLVFCYSLSLSDATKSMFLLFVNLLLNGFSLQLNNYSSLFSRLYLLLNSLTKVSGFINTAWKLSVFRVVWLIFSHIQTENREILSEYRKLGTRKTLNKDTFHVVTFPKTKPSLLLFSG